MRTCSEKPHAARGCRNKKFLYPPLVASLIIAIKDRSIVFSELEWKFYSWICVPSHSSLDNSLKPNVKDYAYYVYSLIVNCHMYLR